MIYYKTIDLENYDVIIEKCKDYIKSIPKIYNRELPNASAYKLSVLSLLKVCPELQSAMTQYGLRIVTAGAYVMYKPEHTSLHIDIYRTRSRINIPIFNCGGTYLNFYSNAKTKIVTNPESGFKNLHVINPEECVIEDSLELVKATVVRITEPHKVILPATNIVPRITLSLGFDKDPSYLLD